MLSLSGSAKTSLLLVDVRATMATRGPSTNILLKYAAQSSLLMPTALSANTSPTKKKTSCMGCCLENQVGILRLLLVTEIEELVFAPDGRQISLSLKEKSCRFFGQLSPERIDVP